MPGIFPTLRVSVCEMKEMAVPACCVGQNNNEVITMKAVCGWKWMAQMQGIVLIRMPHVEIAPFRSITKKKINSTCCRMCIWQKKFLTGKQQFERVENAAFKIFEQF